jgi:hypothetical protein
VRRERRSGRPSDDGKDQSALEWKGIKGYLAQYMCSGSVKRREEECCIEMGSYEERMSAKPMGIKRVS